MAETDYPSRCTHNDIQQQLHSLTLLAEGKLPSSEYARTVGISTVLPAVEVNLPDNTNEPEACKGLIHWEMLIKILAYEKMNDLKDSLDKSSQKWLC